MRRITSFLFAFLLFLLFTSQVSAADCEFRLGFKALRDLIGHEVVGECLENEHYNAIGDSNQQTTGGLMAWRKADNFTAFTDGYRAWINGPFGLVQRLNTERFFWEGDYAEHTPIAEAEVCVNAVTDLAAIAILAEAMTVWFDEHKRVDATLQQGLDDNGLLHDDEWRATANTQLGSFAKSTQEILGYEPETLSVLAYYAPHAAIVSYGYKSIVLLAQHLKALQQGSNDYDAYLASIGLLLETAAFIEAVPEVSQCNEQITTPVPTAIPTPVPAPTPMVPTPMPKPQPTATPRPEPTPAISEERRKGFHCLSDWDGHNEWLERVIKRGNYLNDPDSFKARETRIGALTNGEHYIIMRFTAKNAFGGTVSHEVGAFVDHETCRVTRVVWIE